MSSVSTHVLDTALGRPAAGIAVSLTIQKGREWVPVGHGTTNEDGRAPQLATALEPGTYRLAFDVASYQEGFYPEVTITFRIASAEQHYHVPLLLSPFGFSTYRGS
jgi:5-hydroxyisourate hydrolase